jgi:hypothetical protein
VLDLKEHFAQGAREHILSVFLIAKSSCAFVNYRTEGSCASAVERFHDSRLGGVRVVCRLRRSVGVAGGVPTGPAALNGAKIEGGEGEEGGSSATTLEEETPAKDKYFIMKSLTVEDLEMSVRNGVWVTQLHNEAALDKAYKARSSPPFFSFCSSLSTCQSLGSHSHISLFIPHQPPRPKFIP